jgi:hypothetical protein
MKLNYFTDVSLFFNTIPEYTNAICLILAQFQYSLLPFSSTSKSLAVYCNPTHKIQFTAEPCVKTKPENTEMKLSFTWLMSYVTFSMQGELHW